METQPNSKFPIPNPYFRLMVSEMFGYDKPKVLQALRYHFISRREIKVMMILVNVFALVAAGLFFYRLVSPLAFLVSSLLWFFLMIMFWFALPRIVYKQSKTFLDRFRAVLGPTQFAIENERGHKAWDWNSFSNYTESPHFFHLYFNPRSFFLIPKDAFRNDDEHEARKIFRAMIGSAK